MHRNSKNTLLKAASLAVVLGLYFYPVKQVCAKPVYVSKNSDGSITFSSKRPKPGKQAKVFYGSSAKYSRVKSIKKKGRSFRSSKLYRSHFSPYITAAASRYDLQEELIRAVIHTESAFNPKARSPKGAMGLMQLMPGTARLVGVKQPYDPAQNIRGGAKYLSMMLKRFKGDLNYALAAYNAGPEAVDRYGGIPPYRETKNYVKRVKQLLTRYK